MNIYGIGRSHKNSSCLKYNFLNNLNNHIPELRIADKIPQNADVCIILLDDETINDYLSGNMPSSNTYVIIVVLDLHKSTVDYLKLADHVIFTSKMQQRICDDLLNLGYKSSVLTLPKEDTLKTKGNEVLFAFEDAAMEINENFLNYKIWFCIENLSKHNSAIEKINILIPLHNLTADYVKDFASSKIQGNIEIEVHDSLTIKNEELNSIIEKSGTCSFAKDEYSFAEFDKTMSDLSEAVLYTPVKGSLLLSKLLASDITIFQEDTITSKTFIDGLSQYSDWSKQINELISLEHEKTTQQRKEILQKVKIDTIDSLNIAAGSTLSNNYVFSICFRNQAEKIERCIDSLISQNKDLDFGIAFADDCSDDNSVEKIINKLNGTGVDFCVVANKERRFAAKNFYNIANFIVTNDESVIIEVDGDDFLYDNNALDNLHKYYQKGALKTNGSYRFYTDDTSFFSEEDVRDHHENIDYTKPWALAQCNAWLHLRTSKRKLIRNVELEYFLTRGTSEWLKGRHDSSIQPRIIELSEGKSVFVPEILYYYDVTGDNHDHDNDAGQLQRLRDMFGALKNLYHPFRFIQK